MQAREVKEEKDVARTPTQAGHGGCEDVGGKHLSDKVGNGLQDVAACFAILGGPVTD